MILVLGWGIIILGLLAGAGYVASMLYDWYNETVTVTDPTTGKTSKKSTKKTGSKKTEFKNFDSFDDKAEAVTSALDASLEAVTKAAGKAGASIVGSDIENALALLSAATGSDFTAGYVGSASATGGKTGTTPNTSTTGQGSGRSR